MRIGKARPQTFEEHVFATLLDTHAIDYRCQVRFYDDWLEHVGVGYFNVDFMVHGDTQSYIFEIDGPNHTGQWRARQRDAMRDEFLRAQGFIVVRFTNHQVEHELREVAAKIWPMLIGDML